MARTKKSKTPRLGIVSLGMRYIVDLDDADMVAEAKDCLYEDLMSAYKYDEVGSNIDVRPAKKADKVSVSDIPEFLSGSVDDK